VKPLDLREWLEPLALSEDFAREALELVDSQPFYAECMEIREALEENADPLKFKEAFRLAEHFTDRSNLLGELKDTLEKAGFAGDDISKSLDDALAELDDLRTQLAIVEGEDASRETLEYDL
jgi:hypothetical protein